MKSTLFTEQAIEGQRLCIFIGLLMNSDTGKYLMIAGGLLLVAGVIIYFFHDKGIPENWIKKIVAKIS